MNINRLLTGQGPVTFDDIDLWMAQSEERDNIATNAKKSAATAKEKFHLALMDPKKLIAFECDWCLKKQYKGP